MTITRAMTPQDTQPRNLINDDLLNGENDEPAASLNAGIATVNRALTVGGREQWTVKGNGESKSER
jgi:hypothetical protein